MQSRLRLIAQTAHCGRSDTNRVRFSDDLTGDALRRGSYRVSTTRAKAKVRTRRLTILGRREYQVVTYLTVRECAAVRRVPLLPVLVDDLNVARDCARELNALSGHSNPWRSTKLNAGARWHQQARVTALVAGGAADHRFQIWFEATGGPQIAAGARGD
jgi:hypothetical protein